MLKSIPCSRRFPVALPLETGKRRDIIDARGPKKASGAFRDQKWHEICGAMAICNNNGVNFSPYYLEDVALVHRALKPVRSTCAPRR